MKIYLGGCYIYGFDWWETCEAGYMAKNSEASQEHRKYDKNNMGLRSSLLMKCELDKNQPAVSFE